MAKTMQAFNSASGEEFRDPAIFNNQSALTGKGNLDLDLESNTKMRNTMCSFNTIQSPAKTLTQQLIL
jgi:hypothetical protein